MLSILTRRWWIQLLKGVWTMLVGLAIVLWAGVSTSSLLSIFGIFCLIDGVLSFAIARDTQTRKNKLRRALWSASICSICTAIAALLWFDMGVERLYILVAQWALCRGIFEIAAWLKIRNIIPHERVFLRVGIMSILFNSMLMAVMVLGKSDARWMQLLMGLFLAIRGGLFIAMAMELHRYKQIYQPSRYISLASLRYFFRRISLRRTAILSERPSERQ